MQSDLKQLRIICKRSIDLKVNVLRLFVHMLNDLLLSLKPTYNCISFISIFNNNRSKHNSKNVLPNALICHRNLYLIASLNLYRILKLSFFSLLTFIKNSCLKIKTLLFNSISLLSSNLNRVALVTPATPINHINCPIELTVLLHLNVKVLLNTIFMHAKLVHSDCFSLEVCQYEPHFAL